ncbi:SpvB/TcaC N-terminal domain-containing protein [Micromonospora sp. L32]|uniref:SpvB/TcaC N-terminal domain-containing protein n=1 Tax=Micromonospora sp. L32 TaxID=3452214 RepID=UPI003F8B35C3
MDEAAPFTVISTELADLHVAHDVDVDPFTGAASVRVPLPLTEGRADHGPSLALSYSSGGANSIFGLGWSLAGMTPVTRSLRRRLPSYDDSDGYRYGDCDLVPALEPAQPSGWRRRTATVGPYRVQFFHTRADIGPVRLERWVRADGEQHWRMRDRHDVVTVFGRQATAQISDPDQPERVYAWLPQSRHDSHGNVVHFVYRAEDQAGVVQCTSAARSHSRRDGWPQRHPASVRYGNTVPFGPDEAVPQGNSWLFEAVFDYGDHADDRPLPSGTWPARLDPFSSYRPGFDLRTHRLCRRVLMFHRFAELGPQAALVGETSFGYDEQPAGTTLVRVVHTGVRHDGGAVSRRSLPPLEFAYSAAQVTADFADVPADSLRNAPHGLAEPGSRWIDLHGDGLPGLLTETPDAWYYKPNDGGGRLGAQVLLAARPTRAGASASLGDFDRDGNTDLVSVSGRWAGAASLDRTTGRWSGHRPFAAMPRTDGLARPGTWLDVDGDGLAELLVAGASGLTCYSGQARGGHGFGAPAGVGRSAGVDAPPAVLEAPEKGLFLVDMNGDGLVDLVQVRNGSVRYWPQLGHGRFGDVVTMDGAPVFEPDGGFDPARLRFVDLDGSGTADLIYLGRGELRRWINAAGNGFLPLPAMQGMPYLDRLAAVDVLDFLGDGRPCLVWSSPLPGQSAPVRCAPLAGPVPPRLLTGVTNSVGGEIRLHYGSSVRHLVRDRAAGRDWHTRLPHHPVVVDRRELLDHVLGQRAVSRYDYHDGHFDGDEQEFRGFALVDRYDADTAADPLAEGDPVAVSCVRTWSHTGAADWHRSLADGYRADPGLVTLPSATVAESGVLDADDVAAGLRGLAGRVVRVETYAVTPSGERAPHPCHVTQTHHRARLLQPGTPPGRGPAQPAVLRTHVRETVHHVYEQQPFDPRVTHQVNAEVDQYGTVLLAVEVGCPRRPGPDRLPPQATAVATAQQLHVINIDMAERFECGLPAQGTGFELALSGAAPGDTWPVDALIAAVTAAVASPLLPHQPLPPPATAPAPRGSGPVVTARVAGRTRHSYWSTDRASALPSGQVGAPALPHHVEIACFTPAQVTGALNTPDRTRVDDSLLNGLGYRLREGFWWRSEPVRTHTPAAEFAQPAGTIRWDGATEVLRYDAYHLEPVEQVDSAGNRSSAAVDYHLCTPKRLTDPNGAVEEVRHDPLGVIVARGSRGSVLALGSTGAGSGASAGSDGTVGGSGGATVLPYGDGPLPMVVSWPSGDPADVVDALLADAGAVLGAAGLDQAGEVTAYDVGSWNLGIAPRMVRVARERLVHDGTGPPTAPGVGDTPTAPGTGTASGAGESGRRQVSVLHLDGFGRAAQAKSLMSAGRWLTSGTITHDARQHPVREYEPWFSATPDLETTLVGVARSHGYDAVGRVVRVDEPDGSHARNVFLPWQSSHYDRNDTVQQSLYRVSREALPDGEPAKEALRTAQEHAGTPLVVMLDPLGRQVRQVENTGAEFGASAQDVVTQTRLDAHGEPWQVIDPRGIVALTYTRDLDGRLLHQHSADAGEVWLLPDAAGRPVHRWDGRGVHLRTTFDNLDRPITVRLDDGSGQASRLIEDMLYGEDPGITDAAARNARGRLIRHRDQAGVLVVTHYTPDGALMRSTRQLCADYVTGPDWADPASVLMDPTVHVTEQGFDGLGRVLWRVLPDGTRRGFDHAPEGGVTRVRLALLDGSAPEQTLLSQAVYNARGDRTSAVLGNGVRLSHDFDPETFRTTRITADRPDGTPLQDLAYTYDPVGNLIHSVDHAQQPLAVTPLLTGSTASTHSDYRYDALYRLVSATGRVHQALLEPDYSAGSFTPGGYRGTRHLSLNNGQAVERYTQNYTYDLANNLTRLRHQGVSRGWTTDFWTSGSSNRSLPSLDPAGVPIADPERHFDPVGNLSRLSHLAAVEWGHENQVRHAVIVDRSAANRPDDAEYYTYGADGLRVRKVSQRVVDVQTGEVETVDKVYLDGCEIVRIRRGGRLVLERISSHVDDGDQRVAVVHRWTVDTATREVQPAPSGAAVLRTRYQLGDQMGSAVLELDGGGGVVSYEEFFPYGGSSFLAGDDLRDVGAKDHRFRGAERDDLTGLYYGGHRYYAAWIGRWLSPDPLGPADSLNHYEYCRSNPIVYRDPDGLASIKRAPAKAAKKAGAPPARTNLESVLRNQIADMKPPYRALAERVLKDMSGDLSTATAARLTVTTTVVNGETTETVTLDVAYGTPQPCAEVGELGAVIVPPPAKRPPAPAAAAPPPAPPGQPPSSAPAATASDAPNAVPAQDPNLGGATPSPQAAQAPEESAEDLDDLDGASVPQDLGLTPEDLAELESLDPADLALLEDLLAEMEGAFGAGEPGDESVPVEDGLESAGDGVPLVGSVESGWRLEVDPSEPADDQLDGEQEGRPRGLRDDFFDGFLDEALEQVTDAIVGVFVRRVDPTAPARGFAQLGVQISETYHEEGGGGYGVLGVVNMFNPLSLALRAGYTSDQEAEQALYLNSLGDKEAAAAHAKASGQAYANVVIQSIYLGMLAGGVSAVGKGKGKGKVVGKGQPGDAGAHGKVKPTARNTGLDSHHMPQAARNFAPRAKGGAMLAWRKFHKLTRTYGWKGLITKIKERNLPFRQTLTRDFYDLRKISREQKGSTRYFNKGMLELLEYYRSGPTKAIKDRMLPPKQRVLPKKELNYLKKNHPNLFLNF